MIYKGAQVRSRCYLTSLKASRTASFKLAMSAQYLSPQAWFESGYQKMMGSPASEFRFVPGVTFMSTYREVLLACVGYLVLVFGGQLLMKSRKPIQLANLFRIHNAFLTVLSFGLWVLLLENTIPLVFKEGPFNAVCSPNSFTQQLELLYYINYLTKFYELLDTCFLVLRKKSLKFLHWYHHSMTALLCFTQLEGRTSVSWVPVLLNLGVHVLMYYYYFLATFNIKVWWKKSITVLQITQFVIDLAVIYFCFYTQYTYKYGGSTFGSCSGGEFAAYFGAGLLSSYLLLFVEFFFKAYKKPAAKPTEKIASKTL
ncbi:Fatty acyl-CoA elongase/Polyunsaturated fatty acid specific elongation enzyme [Entomophthora muscae]|uniref:Fatty acyl-CoA elongase/Polyunsaturated fatty acid specific elongation enzyme n=1 Tax=Entomophthora muscae TaxID=34485 RepID=A0ACC2UEK1_9FUNG|nr:Fatty acyl-CoA elongase/Polyunsaturated fatty acid specific elongation enzyme [Entomophthora muscae]